jgi:pimeloyl-ACP methyl ester carboxylesterase
MVGQDIGSRSLQRWRALAPERVHGLVLLNPTHPFIGNEGGSDD